MPASQPAEEKLGVLTLVKGGIGGKPHWAYARIHPNKYLNFKETIATGRDFNLADYADEIYAHGEGVAPPANVQKEMSEKYGANPNFENELQELMAELDAQLNPK